MTVRNGVFEDTCLSPGPALVVLDLGGRMRTVVPADVVAAQVRTLDLTAGGRLP